LTRIINCPSCHGLWRSPECRECDGRGRIAYDRDYNRVTLPTLKEEDARAATKYNRCKPIGPGVGDAE